MTGRSDTSEERPLKPESMNSSSSTLTDSIQTPQVSDHYPECSEREKRKEETTITSIRVTDVALGLRRVPAGFYTIVRHSDLEWTTENKTSLANDDIIEWNGPIPIPSDLSATVYIELYASFEFQPILGAGEQLRKCTTTVEELLDRSAKDLPIDLFPEDGDVVSPCSSILVTVNRRKLENNNSSPPRALRPHCSTTELQGELEDATDQGHSALSRYRKHGRNRDLERSIEEFQRALSICPEDHPCRAAAQSNMAMATFIYSQVEDSDASLEVPLSLYRTVLAARPVGHVDRPSTLVQLAMVHLARFEKQGNESERTRAEELLHEALELIPTESHEKRAATFMLQLHAGRRVGQAQVEGQSAVGDLSFAEGVSAVLTEQLLARFERLGNLADLQQAIIWLQDLLRSISVADDRYRGGLANLGLALWHRFNRLGEPDDLEDAIAMLTGAVDLTNHGDPHKPTLLNSLGIAFEARFKRFGELSDLEDAISMQRDAVYLTPRGHPHRPSWLNNLGKSFLARFDRLGELSDLEDAILTLRGAADLAFHGHPYKPTILNSLGISLFARFERLGELGDLEDAISTLKNAITLAHHGHPERHAYLGNLGNSFRARFEHLGELSDLEQAISMYGGAVEFTPDGHPDKPGWLGNLGNCFLLRVQCNGEQSDLELAVSRNRDAVDLTPHGHSLKPTFMNNLANALKTRFLYLGELSDLEDAISMYKDVVDLTPRGHPQEPRSLLNLGNCFFHRFERSKELSDLEHAISTLRDAMDLLTPHGHPYQPAILNSLGNFLITRFERLGELSDLEVAISKLKDAVDLTLDGHPEKPSRLYNLGRSFKVRFERFEELSNLEQAISLYFQAASAPIGPVNIRFLAAKDWISCARRIRHHSLLHAYSIALGLLPEVAWIGHSLTHRYEELTRCADVVREAAAAALDSGLPETAVEWLEQGRSIVWGELFQLRSSYEELSSTHPDHASRLQELSAALEHASVNHDTSSAFLEQTQGAAYRPTESSEREAVKHRMLAIQRDKLLQDIRGLPGFERFLLHRDFFELRASAHSGPLVILNAAETRCDALIVLADVDHVVHVPLPKFPFKRSTGLQKMLGKLLGNSRVLSREDRKGDPATRGTIGWESLLYTLWNEVVKPVLDALAFSIPGDLSRIFWCPTGPFMFLPIHGAGFYDAQHEEPGHKVSDFVVSSYVPTLSILAPSAKPTAAPSCDLRLLAVRQPPSDGLPQLPGVKTELELIRTVVQDSPSARTTLVESSVGTVEDVLSLMKDADWVHFACHGIQDTENSGLCLADGRRLRLRDVIALSRPRGGLAFLSACQTAMGEEGLSDEAIHLAAGMLFAGYGGVVGTMWSINDKLAPGVARDVYEQLFQNGTRPDYREAARALHEAIQRLRDSGNASFVNWLPFLHVGL